MTHKPHFDSKARRPAAPAAAPQAGVSAATQENNQVKVVHHHGPGFMRPQ